MKEDNCNNRLMYIPVNKILPNPYQTRSGIDRGNINELVQSIKNYGVLQPIGVRIINKKIYELIFGERRLIACKMAGFESIPAIVTKISDREAATLTLTENMQRKNINYIEIAEALSILKDGFGYSEYEISHMLSVDEGKIKEYDKYNSFSKEVKNMLIAENISKDKADILCKLADENIQKDIIGKIKEYGLNTEKAEIIAKGAIREKMIGQAENNHRNIKEKFRDLRLFTNTLNQAVSIINESGMKGEYEVEKNNDTYKICINIDV